MLAKYQYMLSMPVSILEAEINWTVWWICCFFSGTHRRIMRDAEEFSAYSLNTLPGKYKSEEIVLYGVKENSRYIQADFSEGVYISEAYAEKFRIDPGDTLITLKEKYEDDEYSFLVSGIYDYTGSLCIFMEQEKLNRMFDLGMIISADISAIPRSQILTQGISALSSIWTR